MEATEAKIQTQQWGVNIVFFVSADEQLYTGERRQMNI
jgi:hypothetical protein